MTRSWLPDSSDIFVSVGADGSLRAFDLRTLEHSTILYESAADTPLIKETVLMTRHMLACFGMDESKVLILDMRSPGQPVAELVGHQAPVSGIAWGSGGHGSSLSGGGWIASCGTSPLPQL
jgi:WD repeat-containing protein 68